MKVYVVMFGFDYEGSNLDSIWGTFEGAKARAKEILIDQDDRLVPDENYVPNDDGVNWMCRFKCSGGWVKVTEMEVK